MKSQRWRWCFVVAGVVWLAACRSAGGPESRATVMPRPTAAAGITLLPPPTATATLSPPLYFPVKDVSEEYGASLAFDSAFATLPSGVYLIGQLERHLLLYFTLDGARWGVVADIVKKPLPPDWDETWRDETIRGTPPYYIETIFGDETEVGYKQLLVRRISLSSGESRAWLATVPVDHETVCFMGQLSPSGRWFAGHCWRKGENYLYLIDLEQGIGKYIASPLYPCRTATTQSTEIIPEPFSGWRIFAHPGWSILGWGEGDRSLWAYCRDDQEERDVNCTVRLPEASFSCQEVYYHGDFIPFSYAPDHQHLDGFLSPDREKRNEGQVVILPTECLSHLETCDSSIVVEKLTDSRWDPRGRKWVWSYEGDFYTEIGVIDVYSGERNTFQLRNLWVMLDISPDGRWIVVGQYHPVGGLSLFSINGQVLRRLPTPDVQKQPYNIVDVIGWLVIP